MYHESLCIELYISKPISMSKLIGGPSVSKKGLTHELATQGLHQEAYQEVREG